MPLTIRTAEDIAAEARAAHKSRATAAIDGHIEAQARALGYNSAAHLAGYAASTVPEWAAEAQAFIAWRDACWQAAFAMLAEAEESGAGPDIDEAIGAMPAYAS